MNVYKEISANKRRTFYVLFLFTIIVLFILLVASLILDLPLELFPSVSVVVFGIIIFWTIISFYYGDKIILKFVKAKPISRKTHFDIYNLVENLAIASGLPNPKVYVIEDKSLNAFATGRNPEKSVVCLTTGIIEKLSKRELEGVIAHELGHIANYDIRLQLIVVTVIGILSMIGEIFMRARGKKAGPIILTGLFIYLVGAPILKMIKLSLSRNREYLADATGAFYTRDPDSLANALEKISKDARVESADRMNSAAHLFIANPKNEPDLSTSKKVREESFFTKLFSTHPPTAPGSLAKVMKNCFCSES